MPNGGGWNRTGDLIVTGLCLKYTLHNTQKRRDSQVFYYVVIGGIRGGHHDHIKHSQWLQIN